MRKIFITLTAITLLSFTTNEEKKLTVTGTINEWNNVLSVINQSNAPHLQVVEAQNFLLKQLNQQLKDTTKK